MAKFQYGGQAVIEGVMMRGPKEMAIACRRPDDSIIIDKKQVSSWMNASFLKMPVIRGTGALIDAMILGMKALSYSAAQQVEEEEEEITPWEMTMVIVIAMLLGAGLFIAAPTSVAHFIRDWVPSLFWQNVIEGIVRMALFFGYVYAISRMEDIQRVFQYHGAEHKVIHAHEAGVPLTVENAQKFTTLHPRCGTSFLLFVMVIKIFVFSLLPNTALVGKIAMRLALVPLVAGIAYEVIKFSGRYPNFWLMKIFTAPGLWMQKLTTKEPSDSQVEVAIRALQAVLPESAADQGQTSAETVPENQGKSSNTSHQVA